MVTETDLKLVGDFLILCGAFLPLISHRVAAKRVSPPKPGSMAKYHEEVARHQQDFLYVTVAIATVGFIIKVIIYL